ncbi:MAG: hypothetical protein WCQ47_06585 [bacterium]
MPKSKKDRVEKRSYDQFSKTFQLILYSQPKHLAILAFYLVISTAIILGTWSYFSIVNKSYSVNGEIIHLNPDISISPSFPFKFKRHIAHIGQYVKHGDVLFEYISKDRKIISFKAKVSGLVSKNNELKQGITYKPFTEVLSIKSEEKDIAVQLHLPSNLLNKIKTSNRIVYHFNFSFGPKKEKIEGTIIGEPIMINNQYIVEANIDDKSLKFLDEQKIKLIEGIPLTAEVVIGKERLISRFLGVNL